MDIERERLCFQVPDDEVTEMSEVTEATDATDISEASDQENNKKVHDCHYMFFLLLTRSQSGFNALD